MTLHTNVDRLASNLFEGSLFPGICIVTFLCYLKMGSSRFKLQSFLPTRQFQITKGIFAFSYQQTPLHVTARKGRDYTVEWLVKKGADVNVKDNDGVSVSVLLMVEQHC